MVYFMKQAWAENGDTTQIPTEAQEDNTVSYESGWTEDYELSPEIDINAKVLSRSNFNGLFSNITTILQQFQIYGVNPFITSEDNGGTAFSYPLGGVCSFVDETTNEYGIYYSLAANNTDVPSTGGAVSANWLRFDNLEEQILRKIPASRNIGEIVTSTIPLTDANLHLLDGALLSGNGIYADFVAYISNLYANNVLFAWVYNDGTDDFIVYTKTLTIESDTSLYNNDGSLYAGSDFEIVSSDSNYIIQYNANDTTYTEADNIPLNYFTTESDWQSSVTSYGVCGKFVYDPQNNTVRIPRITGFIEGSISASELGNIVTAGLPNISGDVGGYSIASKGSSGCFTSTRGSAGFGSAATAVLTSHMDASLSSPIYGNSNTVQPQSIKILFYVVVANSTIQDTTQIDINQITTDLNGKADTDFSNVTAVHIIEDYVNGGSGYRIWSNGYCEQWGLIPAANGYSTYSVTLLRTFKDLNYVIHVTSESIGQSYAPTISATSASASSKTPTGFKIIYVISMTGKANWTASGYLATGEN